MSVSKRHGTLVFHSDICGVRRFDRSDSRLAFVVAREDGWRLSKQHGKWETSVRTVRRLIQTEALSKKACVLNLRPLLCGWD